VNEAAVPPAHLARQAYVLQSKQAGEWWRLVGLESLPEPTGGGGFGDAQDSDTESHASYLACFGSMKSGTPESEFTFFDRPGTYTIVVRDPEAGLASNELSLELTPPREPRTAEAFRSGGLNSFLLILSPRHAKSVPSGFERLVAEDADATYSKYAQAALSLRQFEILSQEPGDKSMPLHVSQIQRDLGASATLFPAGHPLRSQCLFALSRLPCTPPSTSCGQDRLRQLLSETRDGVLRAAARETLDRLTRAQMLAPGSQRKQGDGGQ
jgi:hypothetical protein